ncbi:MAG: PAS domain-containing protein, partial [Chitinophagaceae bacterium]
MFATALNFFTSEEIALLAGAANDISFSLDVFEKQQQKLAADNLLKHKESRLNQAQAIAHIGSWELNFLTGILTWSKEAHRIHGLTPNEGVQTYKSWLSFIHPEDVNHVLQVTNKAASTFSNYSVAHRIIKKDGEVRYVYCQAQYEFGDDNQPIGLNG